MTDAALGTVRRLDFPSTQWSVVARASADDSDGRAALAELCREYWYPLYVVIRRSEPNAEAAKDLTQSFFQYLFEGDVVARADQCRGRFRDFLLGVCRKFLLKDRRKAMAEKRGGQFRRVPFDFAAADARYSREAEPGSDLDRQFTKVWAMTVLERATAKLQAKYEAQNEGDLFRRLSMTLARSPGAEKYAGIAVAIGMPESTVRKRCTALKEQFRMELRKQVALTVATEADVDRELSELAAALAG